MPLWTLQESDDAAEAKAGKAMDAKFKAVQAAGSTDALVAAIDGLVDSIDQVTNLCDATE